MRMCTKCSARYTNPALRVCPQDGTALQDVTAPIEVDPLVGTELMGRYRIRERVGTGGMGAVYRADQESLLRPVAIKILKSDLIWDSDTVTRFHREAKAMSMLTHPNTVRVFDFGETADGQLFLVLELLEGELLSARLNRDAMLTPLEAVKIASQMLRSLAEAHNKAIIHRDLKPDNIYLVAVDGSNEPVVKVLDFGIAKVVEPDRRLDELETQAGTVFGTPRFMSPEQAQGKPLDGRSDLYSVGTLLYQMLTGRPPFTDMDAVVVMAKHIRENPEPPRRVAPEQPIPESLERVVLRAMAKSPDKRFANADIFREALEACIPDIEREARESTLRGIQALRKSSWKRRFAWAGAVALAAGLAALLAMGVTRISEQQASNQGPQKAIKLRQATPAAALTAPSREAVVPSVIAPEAIVPPQTDVETTTIDIGRGAARSKKRNAGRQPPNETPTPSAAQSDPYERFE